jgi:hypothetical protein
MCTESVDFEQNLPDSADWIASNAVLAALISASFLFFADPPLYFTPAISTLEVKVGA